MSEVNKTKILPPYLVLTSMLAMFLLDRYFPLIVWQHTQLIGYAFLAASFLCLLYCGYVFHSHKTAIKPFEESTFLILSWPYTISRNPIYLCMIVFLISWGLWLQSIMVFIIIPVFAWWVHKRFVLQEESMLEDQFGNHYLAYKKRVRRWV